MCSYYMHGLVMMFPLVPAYCKVTYDLQQNWIARSGIVCMNFIIY